MKKILLQSFETGLYLDSIGAWTNDPELARDFPNTVKATKFKLDRRLSHAFVVVVPEPTQPAEPAGTTRQRHHPRAHNYLPICLSGDPNDPKHSDEHSDSLEHSARKRTMKDQERKLVRRQRVRLVMPPERLTIVEANVDVGPGNAVYIRGQGDGLSWEHGQRLSRVVGGRWIWTTCKAKAKVRFKLLLNDEIWAKGEDVTVQAGKLIELAPLFYPIQTRSVISPPKAINTQTVPSPARRQFTLANSNSRIKGMCDLKRSGRTLQSRQ